MESSNLFDEKMVLYEPENVFSDDIHHRMLTHKTSLMLNQRDDDGEANILLHSICCI